MDKRFMIVDYNVAIRVYDHVKCELLGYLSFRLNIFLKNNTVVEEIEEIDKIIKPLYNIKFNI